MGLRLRTAFGHNLGSAILKSRSLPSVFSTSPFETAILQGSTWRFCFALSVWIRLDSVFREDVKLLQLIETLAQLRLAKAQ